MEDSTPLRVLDPGCAGAGSELLELSVRGRDAGRVDSGAGDAARLRVEARLPRDCM